MTDGVNSDGKHPLQTAPSGAGRLAYEPPRLRHLGRVRDITLGSFGANPDPGLFGKNPATAG